MLVNDIKTQVTAAMKSGDKVARDILRLALGEIQTAEARKADALDENATDEARKAATLSEEEATAVVRKLIKSNEETLALAADSPDAPTLRREVEILSALLPKQLSVDDIVAALASEHEAIKAAKSDGQATGVAMKHLKTTGASINGNDVGAAVKKIRAGS